HLEEIEAGLDLLPRVVPVVLPGLGGALRDDGRANLVAHLLPGGVQLVLEFRLELPAQLPPKGLLLLVGELLRSRGDGSLGHRGGVDEQKGCGRKRRESMEHGALQGLFGRARGSYQPVRSPVNGTEALQGGSSRPAIPPSRRGPLCWTLA